MREHVGPLFRLAAPCGMCVDDAVLQDDGPTAVRTEVVLASNDMCAVTQWRKKWMVGNDCPSVVERTRGWIDRVLLFAAAPRHGSLSSPSARRAGEGRERLRRGTNSAARPDRRS